MKAVRNRTLELTDDDRDVLRGKLQNKFVLNSTINVNLFEILESLPEKFADLIIIDPPYNLAKDFNGFKFVETKDEPYKKYLESWLPQICKCLKDDGSLYLCGDWKSSVVMYDVLSKNLNVINRITWQREKGRGAKLNWKNGMEDIYFAVKDVKNYYFDVEAVKVKKRVLAPYKQDGKPKDWQETEDGKFRLTHPSNLWDDISIPYWSMPENTEHPTQKPEKLIAKLILASCPKKGVVFDPFLGSGTTSVVAKKLGRQYVGVEMNEEYAMLAEKRLQMAAKNKNIQGFEKGVFLERNFKK
ncbi:MAG: site-specific DNA-methyltransferase [Alphaproteobacteria bacterium]